MTKPGTHDRRGFYRKGELPRHARVGVVTIEDPYAAPGYVNGDGTLDLDARRLPFVHRDGTSAEGAPGWTPPPRPTITVIRSLKGDPLARMHSRRQIDQSQFLAGRAYQECFAAAQISNGGSGFANVAVSGGGIADPLTEGRQRALQRLRILDLALMRRHGGEGVGLVRDVLGECLSIEQAARRRATGVSERATRTYGWLFRKCLDVIAFKLGYATTEHRPKR